MAFRCITLATLFGAADATSYTWRGIIDDQWTTPNNWQPVGTPGDNPADVVTIDDAEGKDTKVQLTKAKTISRLNLGDKLAAKAQLTLLSPLTVTAQVSIPPNGALQINSGTAALNTPEADIQGKLEFYSGTLQGTYNIHGAGQACFGSKDFQGSKTFNRATVSINTAKPVLAGGPWQFDQNSTITIKTAAIEASGNAFQIQLKNYTGSKGNSITQSMDTPMGPGINFSWKQ